MFSTTDLGLASYLYASGVRFQGIKPSGESWQKLFCFEEDESLQTLLREWQRGSATINALSYWKASRFLKHAVKRHTSEEYS